jgi:3-hexulose-6-phosphate synthase
MENMKIQISFDSCSEEEILEHAKTLEPYYTHLYLGTVPLYRYGITLIRALKKEVPDKKIMLKLQLADHVKEHAQFFSPLGIHSVSVIPGITRTMLHAAAVAAHNQHIKVILEMFDISYINQSISDAETVGIDAVLFHHVQDKENQQTLQEQVDFVRENINIPVYLETSVTLENLPEVINTRPDGIVLKEEIVLHKNAEIILQHIQEMIHKDA